MKKNIIVIGPMPPPIGGMQTVLEQMTHLKLEDYNLVFMNISKNRLIKSNILFNSLNFFYRCLKLIGVIIYYRPKIIHIHSSWKMGFWQSAVFQKLSKIFRKKTILHMHSGGFESFYNESGQRAKKLITKILNEADSLIVLSKSWKKYYSNISNNTNITILSNAIDLEMLKKYIKPRKKSKTTKLLFVGRIEKAKGIYELLEAIKMLKNEDIHLDIIGAFVDNEQEMKELCVKYNIVEKITFLGVIQGNERFKYYANSDIFVLPSYWEGLPMTILEAMALGLPIIATNVGAIPEVVKKENGIIIEPRNSQNIVKAVIQVMQNKKIKYEVNNGTKIKKEYDIPVFKMKISKIYDTLK